jgi:hypothetical protein
VLAGLLRLAFGLLSLIVWSIIGAAVFVWALRTLGW